MSNQDTIELNAIEPGRQIVRLEFTAPTRDLRFKAEKGLTPWFASSATAPFPK